ncbi:PREDICTED: uncharacterized protein LOC18586526 [Theobroma cacao]|uniref:Uncharacterized protein LOC18586526 n=1 Tax=Theobroma cacao TaxID=3641 RepID=A0AB32WYG3_THECC|nr:PREDICTED: uncharacterized protein LOC18586526 [Theobroma cacao]
MEMESETEDFLDHPLVYNESKESCCSAFGGSIIKLIITVFIGNTLFLFFGKVLVVVIYARNQDCSYIVHVTCATEDEDLYYIVDSENQDEPIESSIGCSITCVIEVNECGEATKINHFSHEHYLILEDKIEEDDDKHCDGCMLSILDSFYYCLQCDFLFPKTCAELPMKKYYWSNPHLQNLKSNCIFECNGCYYQCSDFACNCDECDLSLCLKCARISDIVIYQGHEHPLFCDLKYKGGCTACGIQPYHAYRCKDCNYAFAF